MHPRMFKSYVTLETPCADSSFMSYLDTAGFQIRHSSVLCRCYTDPRNVPKFMFRQACLVMLKGLR